MEETISLNEIFEVIKKRFKIIISSVVILTLLVAVISLFVLTPIYEASSQFIVNESESKQAEEFDSNTIRTNVEVINTYNVIITSTAILDDVVDALKLSYGAAELAQKITVSSEEDSQVVNVTVSDPDQKVAAGIANEVVTTFESEIPDIMNVDNVSVLTTAEELTDPSPVSPNVTLNIAIGLILGLMIGIGIAFIIEYLDTTIKTSRDIEKQIDVPVLGSISTIETSDLGNEASYNSENSPKRSRS